MSQETLQTIMQIAPLVLLILLMYFMLIRPQKKKEKEVNAMRSALKAGDSIVTIGGICGKVVKVKDETIIIQVGNDKIKMELMKWAVSQVVASKGTKLSNKDDVYGESSNKPKRLKKSEKKDEVIDVEIEPVADSKKADKEEEKVEAKIEKIAEEANETGDVVVEIAEETTEENK